MKLNRIGSLIIIAFALAIILSQSGSIPAAAHSTLSGVTAQLNPSAAGQSRQSKTQRPTDQAPYKVTVQGRLTDPSGNPITSAVNVSFNVYTTTVGGSPIFSEGPVSITPDSRGLLTYQLGSTSVISTALVSQFANTLYLGLTVGTDAEMAPRILLTAAPYAMSLAPGTVVSGAYGTDNLTTNFGVINGVNLDKTTITNAGLYGKGVTGVYGEADPSGGFGGYGGEFINNGGYAGEQLGIFAASNSTGGHSGIGGSFYNSGSGSGSQYGVRAQNYATAGTDGYGGQFTNAGGGSGTQYGVQGQTSSIGASSGVGGSFINTGGGSGTQYGVFSLNSSTNGIDGYGGSFDNLGGGSGNQYGVYAHTNSAGGVDGYGGNFVNDGHGSGIQYGVNTTISSIGGTRGYAGYFYNSGGGSGAQYGISSYAPVTGSAGGYSGLFDSDSGSAVAVSVHGKIQASGGCCASANYDVMAQYHGTQPLHVGDVLAADGNNSTIDGTPTLGVVKATAQNAKAAIGVVQYRFKSMGKDAKSGRTNWQVDEAATSFQSGDLLSAVVLGQVLMKATGQASIGDRIALAADGSPLLASDDNKYPIGKVVSQPDRDGYVTVFVNLK